MQLLAIFDGKNFNVEQFDDALLITLVSMLLTFAILFILLQVINLLKLIKNKEK